jgi:hypothetical protein
MDVNLIAHENICNDLKRLIESFFPSPSKEKMELLRAIDAYRLKPDLLKRIEELEQAIHSLVRTYLGDEAIA